jgi:polyphenol oxidase
MQRIYKNELHFRVFDILNEQSGLEHMVTERNRECENSGLNLSFNTGENIQKVNENRERVIRLFDLPPDKVFFPDQCHTAEVKVVDFHITEQSLQSTDAIITNKRGICIGVLTADCVPILLYDPVKSVIAAVHAGWRGTVGEIVKNTISRMIESFNVHPSNLIAALGPSISGKNYQVGPEVVEKFRFAYNMDRLIFSHFTADGRANLDLWECNHQILLNCGVQNDRIELAGICTYDRFDNFFSARREGFYTGRFASCIMLT